jgi:large subunit ribosomal protein L14
MQTALKDYDLCGGGGAEAMKAKQSKTPRALSTRTRMICADNTGAREVQIVSVFGYHGVRRRQPKMGLGDLATVTVKKGTPDMRRKLVRAVVIRQRKEIKRPSGLRITFDDNAVVVVDEKNEPRGTEIKGPVAREVAERFPKIGSMATMIV